MRSRKLRTFAAIAALALLAAACSKPDNGDVATGGDGATTTIGQPVTPDTNAQAPETVPLSPGETVATTPSRVAKGGKPAPRAKPGAKSGTKATVKAKTATTIGNPDSDQAQARAVGAKIRAQSTEKRNSHPGVKDDEIKLVFSYDRTICGVNAVTALTAAGGALPTQTRFYRNAATTPDKIVAENEESIKTMVDFWNLNGFNAADYAPEVRKLMGNDETHQFYGRRLVGVTVDGGSNQCPDKTTAAAKEAVEKDALIVFNNFDGAATNMALNLANTPVKNRPMHFGTLWLADQTYSKFAPYVWTQFATGSTITRQSASYVCSKLVGPNALPARARDVPDAKKRVFGLVHTNLPQDKLLAAEYKGYLEQFCGKPFVDKIKEVEYEGTDFAKAQQDNPNVVLQLKLAGVTTVLMLTEPIQPLFQIQAMSRQSYLPELVFSSFGYADSNTVQRLYDETASDVMKGSFGTSNLGVPGGFGFGAGDPFFMYHSSHKKSPTSGQACDPKSDAGMNHDAAYCKAPTALVTWYYTMLPAIGGIIFAGPDVNPTNITNGLQAYPVTRYGGNGPTSDPRPALVGAGKGKHGFIVDAAEWRWHPEFKSPQPENKDGWVEYPDCQRHYLLWPDQLAPNWEKNGEHYNAWCGNKDGYPRVLPSDSEVAK